MLVCALCGQPAALVWMRFTDASQQDVQNVFSCTAHQISSSLADLTHLYTCTAPNAANLPSCDCTPVDTSVTGLAKKTLS